MTLEPEFDYFIKNQSELVDQYEGKVIAIKGCEVIGSFESEAEAVFAISKKHDLGTFLVQRCIAGAEAYTQTFHSRVF